MEWETNIVTVEGSLKGPHRSDLSQNFEFCNFCHRRLGQIQIETWLDEGYDYYDIFQKLDLPFPKRGCCRGTIMRARINLTAPRTSILPLPRPQILGNFPSNQGPFFYRWNQETGKMDAYVQDKITKELRLFKLEPEVNPVPEFGHMAISERGLQPLAQVAPPSLSSKIASRFYTD